MADLFKRTPSRLLCEAFSHGAINARGLFFHIISTAVYIQVLIHTTVRSDVKRRRVNEHATK